MSTQNRNRLTDLENKFLTAKVGMGQRDNYGVWDGHIHTAVFKMHNQQGPTVQHMELYSMLCASLDGSGVWERIETCICTAKSFCCSLENITL